MMDQTTFMQDMGNITLVPQRVTQKKEPLNGGELTEIRRLVGRINWAVQGTRPDIAFDMVDLSTKFRKGLVGDLIRASKVIHKLKEDPAVLVFPRMGDPRQWKLVLFTDAAHANLNDNGVSSMAAHVLFLVNGKGQCCALAWHAGKVKRVVRSTIAAEALSLQEGLEDAFYVRQHIEDLLSIKSKTLPVVAFVDNKSVVEAIHSTK